MEKNVWVSDYKVNKGVIIAQNVWQLAGLKVERNLLMMCRSSALLRIPSLELEPYGNLSSICDGVFTGKYLMTFSL